MRLAYADPPYLGQARKHYGPEAREVDHALLIAHLLEFDGWALSLSSPSISKIAPLLPEGVRWGAWVKPFASFKPGVNPAYAWEPVVFKPARTLGEDVDTARDWVRANITLRRGVSGAKPVAFCRWLFAMLGAERTDQFHDLFPGSGAVNDAWIAWVMECPLPLTPGKPVRYLEPVGSSAPPKGGNNAPGA